MYTLSKKPVFGGCGIQTNKLVAINMDAMDPAFAQQLRQLGAVQPNPHLSHSSIAPGDPSSSSSQSQSPYPHVGPDPRTHPAVMILTARQRLQDEADREFMSIGRRGNEGRSFLDVSTIRQVLMMRDEKGMSAEQIERLLELRKGVVAKLGSRKIVESG